MDYIRCAAEDIDSYEVHEKECFGLCPECAWYYTNGGCSEWTMIS